MPPPAAPSAAHATGVSLVYLTDDGRIKELIEYRQPTHEEMLAFLRRDPQHPDPAVERLLLRGHAVPQSNSYCHVEYGQEISPSWRVQAVQLATEWVETWTPSMSLEDMVGPAALLPRGYLFAPRPRHLVRAHN